MKVGIVGCGGFMGRTLIVQVLDTGICTLVGGIECPNSPDIGLDLATLVNRPPIGVSIGKEPQLLFDSADVIIDFSSPSTTATNAALAEETCKALVVGTTGLGPEQTAALAVAGKRAPVLYSSNMSLGVNVLFVLVEQVSRILNDSYDISILDIHHRRKVDTPSGTAIELGQAAALGRGIDLLSIMPPQWIRGDSVSQRQKGDICFAAIRGGDVVGEHSIIFTTDGEQVELTHKATSREIFARGAILAALWLYKREPGLYSMRNVLGIG